jgi:hypothetical protein
VPAAASADPRARIYIVDHLAPGAVIQRRVEVANSTTSVAHVDLYASAADIGSGSFLGADGHTANDLSTWTSVDPGSADVPVCGSATAVVTITVPRDAGPGEQYGVVWAETRTSPADGGITQVSRVGVRLYVSVGPGGAPAADFTIASLTAERAPDGHPVVVASVHNTGGRALDLGGTLALTDGPGALSAGPFDAVLGTTVAVGDTEPVRIDLDPQLPAGPWHAVITLHSGLVERTATATIAFPDAGSAAAVATSSGGSRRPYVLYAGLLLALVALVTVAVVVRRRRSLVSEVVATPTGS